MSRRDPRKSQAVRHRNECPVTANGRHRSRQSMQPWPPDLDAAQSCRPRSPVSAGPLMSTDGAQGLGPVLALCGPTGIGKTEWAVRLAEQLSLEIVSVDSALVYRGLDIGTAKPSRARRARVPHHLIDICEASEAYSAGRFVADAMASIAAIEARKRVPL